MIIDVHTHINNYHEEKEVSLEGFLSKLTDTTAENYATEYDVPVMFHPGDTYTPKRENTFFAPDTH